MILGRVCSEQANDNSTRTPAGLEGPSRTLTLSWTHICAFDAWPQSGTAFLRARPVRPSVPRRGRLPTAPGKDKRRQVFDPTHDHCRGWPPPEAQPLEHRHQDEERGNQSASPRHRNP